MGKFIKFVVYVLLIIVLYLLGRGIYDGSITKQSTLESVAQQVTEGTRNLADNGIRKVENIYDKNSR